MYHISGEGAKDDGDLTGADLPEPWHDVSPAVCRASAPTTLASFFGVFCKCHLGQGFPVFLCNPCTSRKRAHPGLSELSAVSSLPKTLLPKAEK